MAADCRGRLRPDRFVLDDETRVLSRASFVRAIGRTGKVKGGRQFDDEFQTPVFLSADNLKPFFPSNLDENSKPILFQHNGKEMIGYKAELLADVCDIFADADKADALHKNQQHIADACRLLARGLTRVGIVGLVDEATGYQRFRAAYRRRCPSSPLQPTCGPAASMRCRSMGVCSF